MRKVKLIAHPKSPPESKKKWPNERKGEDGSERPIKLPIDPINSTYIRPIGESGEDSLDLNSFDEPLLVDVGSESLHIEVPKATINENGSTLVIFLVSPRAIQSPSVQQILEKYLHIRPV